MYTHANPRFTIKKWGVMGYSLHGLVSMISDVLCGFGCLVATVWERAAHSVDHMFSFYCVLL